MTLTDIKVSDKIKIGYAGKLKWEWRKRLIGLGEFLSSQFADCEVFIAAYADSNIGGLRISEVTFAKGNEATMAFNSFMRQESPEFVLRCEQFLSTYGIKPYRPVNWKSCINEHGESRIGVLSALELKDAAEAEYQQQLEEEKKVP